jgi:hypothetical protein
MAGLVPAIHVFGLAPKTWMPGTRPGMTVTATEITFYGNISVLKPALVKMR